MEKSASKIISIETVRFGTLEIHESDVIVIDRGLLGFPVSERYFMFPHGEEGRSPFYWLQSLDEPSLSFLVLNPFEFFPTLEVVVSDEDARALGVEDEIDLEIFTLVTIPHGKPSEVRTNLAGPVVVNVHNRRGRQILLPGQPSRQLLLPEAMRQRSRERSKEKRIQLTDGGDNR